MIKVVIVDDEKYCIEVIETLIKEYFPSVEILGTFTSPAEAIPYILKSHPDLIFLDIEMPVMNGFEVIEKLKPYQYDVVFTTAHDDMAVKAFKYQVSHYLLKPISLSDLKDALQRFIDKKQKLQPTEKSNKLTFNTHEGIHLLKEEDILYCEADDSYTIVFLSNGNKLVVSKTLKDIEAQLSSSLFFRVHHSYIANLKCISKYSRGDGGSIQLGEGIELPVSRSKKEELMKVLDIR